MDLCKSGKRPLGKSWREANEFPAALIIYSSDEVEGSEEMGASFYSNTHK